MRRLSFLILAGLLAAPALAQDDAGTAPPDVVATAADDAAPAGPASSGTAQRYVEPYIELGQVVDADLTGRDDVLTYTEVAVGVDAGISTRRTQAQVSARYERHIGETGHDGDDDTVEGLAQADVGIVPGVSIDGGALATRTRSDIRGAAPIFFDGNNPNVSQVYSGYVGPSLVTNVGPVGVTASYQYGYTKVEDPSYTDIGPGQPRLDRYDSSHSNVLQGSVGTKSGDLLPVGVTISGAWDREEANQLKQRYDGKFGRADVVLPVSRTLALEGGVGYENITISQKDVRVDANGAPVVDNNGRYVTDNSSPRRIAYRTDGLIYDAGVMWRPSPRTQLEAHVGKRYGSTDYAGTFTYQASPGVGMAVIVYNEIDTFGRQLRQGLEALPASFVARNGQFGNSFSGCVFGKTGAAAGGCLNDVFQSISTSSYRARGVDAVIVANRGPISTGFGVGYANRHFYAPDTSADFSIAGFDDESYYAQYFLSRALDARSSVEGDLYANYFDSGIPGAAGVYGVGATGSYNRSFGRIDAIASLGVYATGSKNTQDDVTAQALVTARYQF